jgi:hypothetical protein
MHRSSPLSSLLLSSALVLTLSACGGEGSATPASAAVANTPSPAPTTGGAAAAPAARASAVTTVTTAVSDFAAKTVDVVANAATAAASLFADAVTEAAAPVVEAVAAAAAAPTTEMQIASSTAAVSTASAPLEPVTLPEGTLDIFTTRSGHWRLHALPAQGDAAVYAMTLDENPAFRREFACRRIFTKEAGDATALDYATVRLLDTDTRVVQGSCRVVQNMEPVAPNADWIREAVAAGVLPAYKRSRAWLSGLDPLARNSKRGAYDPTSLGPRTDGSTSAPNSGHNYVGVTSAQGGEYSASRGFLHNADARVIDAALHHEDGAIANYWTEFTQYTLYSLAQPQGAAWSATNHVTIDPQFPQAGDRPYEIPFHNSPNPNVDSMKAADSWSRDVAHMENTGFVHWLATEDPIAGLLIQRQAAYVLGGRFEYLRGGYSTYKPDVAYEAQTEQERALFNTLSALWKSRDVSRRVTSLAGRMFWSAARAQRQADEVIAFYDKSAARIEASTTAKPEDYVAKLSGALFGAVMGDGAFDYADGTTVTLRHTSAFQAVQYGKEPLWLWTKAGQPAVRRWFTTYATGLALRMSVIGGAMGVDGRTSRGGSGYPIGPTQVVGGTAVAAIPPFSTSAGWAEWVAALPLKQIDSRTTFNGASIHTAMQMEGALLMAKDAGLAVPELDAALGRLQAAKSATTALRYPDLQMHKHLGAPAQ